MRRGGRPDGEVPDDHAAAHEHHRGVEHELPPLEPGAPRQREDQQRGERQQRVGEIERIGPGDRRILVPGEHVPGRDGVADEHHAAADAVQAERPADARIQDLVPRGEHEQDQHAEVERHEGHVPHQVADGLAAPVALLPDQVEHAVQRRQERDGADRDAEAAAALGLGLRRCAHAEPFKCEGPPKGRAVAHPSGCSRGWILIVGSGATSKRVVSTCASGGPGRRAGGQAVGRSDGRTVTR